MNYEELHRSQSELEGADAELVTKMRECYSFLRSIEQAKINRMFFLTDTTKEERFFWATLNDIASYQRPWVEELKERNKRNKGMLKMIFVFNDEKAHALGYSAQTCYEAIDKLFARYGIVPTSQGVYETPDNQNSFNAFGAAQKLPYSNWFLKVIEQWLAYDEDNEPEDCLAVYNHIQERNKE